jgi:hypothetical protein
MVCAGAPKPFWANAIELKAYVCSNTAHNIYSLQEEVPETVMSSKSLDISQFCEFAFYDWVMFCNEPITFPNDNPVLSQYLGLAINVGPALTTKILKVNEEVVYRSRYCELTTTKVNNGALIDTVTKYLANLWRSDGRCPSMLLIHSKKATSRS